MNKRNKIIEAFLLFNSKDDDSTESKTIAPRETHFDSDGIALQIYAFFEPKCIE